MRFLRAPLIRHALATMIIAGATALPLAIISPTISSAAVPATSYSAGTPSLATITDGTSQAPWNEFQGDGGVEPNESVLPTYTPSSGDATWVDGFPNLAVVSSALNATPYPSGTVGTPGPLDGYCGAGDNVTESAGTPALQPVGSVLPMAPAYFPHIVRNADGSLTGYFDYRPKDAQEAIVVAKSTDGGQAWTYEGEALEQNSAYCPNSDTNDDGEGHPNVITVGGHSYLYTLPRAAGDNLGVGMLVHTLSSNASDPLSSVPTVESAGIDPNDFASSAITVPASGGTGVTIPLTTAVGTGPEQLVAGNFVDVTATPTANKTEMIDCIGVSSQSLTGCLTTGTSAIAVSSQDLIEQVIATAAAGTIPVGPNNTTGTSGLSSLTITGTNSNNLSLALLNNNAPGRLYIDGIAVYCSQSNADPTSKIEDCTTPQTGGLSVAAGDPITGDPIVPATATQTTGLVAPDGIVGQLPTYPGAPEGSTIIMYTEKLINYFDIGYSGGASTFGTLASAGITYTNFWNTASASAGSSGSYSFSLGDATTNQPVTVNCTGQSTTSTGGSFTGCTSSAAAGDVITKNSYLVAPGGATTTSTTLGEIGEGNATSAQKMFKDNEDLSILRVAYTTNGTTFSSAGLTNNGIISGAGAEAAVNTTTGAVTCTSGNETPASGYTDISDPCSTASPSNLNAYAGNDAANSTAGSTGGSDTNGSALDDEMRWVGSAGSIITNPDGTYGLFLSGAWENDGDSDAFNQIFYSTSTNGENWTEPVSVISTDYSFAASSYQDANPTTALGISAYYSGRAYAPSVVQNPDGSLTMLFAGDRFPKSVEDAGVVLGTNAADLYTVGADDPVLYRNILVDTLTPTESGTWATTTTPSASSTTVAQGDSVTLSATVASSVDPGLEPTGTVVFSDTSGTLCTGTLNDSSPDVASCSVALSSLGPDNITATYSGDSGFAGSSNSTSVTVAAGFTTGDLVVSEDAQSATGNLVDQVNLVDYSKAGTPSGFSVALPTSASGANNGLVDYGGYENGGLLNDTADGGNLVVAGYEPSTATVLGSLAPGSDHAGPDVVGIVGSTGAVDTSTVLNDGTTGTENTHYDRSAIAATSGTALDGGPVYVSGSQAIDELPQGGTQTTDNLFQASGTDNAYGLQIYNGNLYASGSASASASGCSATHGAVWEVGSGLPTTGTQTDTAIVCSTNASDTTHFSPEQFVLLTAGSGSVNTLYVADSYSSAGVASSEGAVEKYTCTTNCGVSTGWTAEGAVTVAYPTGLVATDTSSGVDIFATGGNNAGAAANKLYEITDASCSTSSATCATTTLTGATVTTLATAPGDDEFHGLAWAPSNPLVPLAQQQTLTVTSTTGTALTPLALTYGGGSGTGAVSYAVTTVGTANCSLTGNGTTVTATTAGTCTVTATKASDGTYQATSSVATTITFGLAAAATLSVTSTAGTALTPLTLTSSGGSGTGAITYAVTTVGTANCSLTGSGTTVSATAVGSCTVTATQASDGTYGSNSSQATAINFVGATPATISLTSTSGTALTPLALTYSGGSGSGAISYAVTTTGSAACTLTNGGTTVTAGAAGSCTVTVTQASDGTYASNSSTATAINFALATPATISVMSTSGTALTPLTLTANGGSGDGTVSYLVTSAGSANCSLTGSGTTVTATMAGSCTVTVTQNSDGTYASNTSTPATITFVLATPSDISVTSTSGTVGTALALTSSGGSGTGAVSYAVTNAGSANCTLTNEGTTLTATAAGSCDVTVTQGSDGTYSTNTSDATEVDFYLASPAALDLSSTSGTALTPLTLTSSGGSGTGAITYAVTTAGSADCSITGEGTTVTAADAGSCDVTATQASDGTYASNSSEPTAIDFVLATPLAISLTSTSGTVGSALTLTYGGSSGTGAVSYAVTTVGTAGCTLTGDGSTLSATSAGTCTVTVSRAADSTYASDSSTATVVTFSAASTGGGTTTTTTAAPPPAGTPSADLGTPTSATLPSGTGSTPTVVTSTVTTSSGATASANVSVPSGALPAGTTVSAYPVTNSTTLAADVPTGQSYVLGFAVSWSVPAGDSATATAPITLTVNDPGILEGDIIYELTSTGLMKVGVATADGVATITFTTDPTFVVAALASQTVSFGSASTSAKVGTSTSLDAVATSGQVVTYALASGSTGCTLSGTTLAFTGTGSCSVTASQDGGTSYFPATATLVVAVVLPARPALVTVKFAGSTARLTAGAKAQIHALAKKLIKGASVTLTGYAKADAKLATARAKAVRTLLAALVTSLHVKLVARSSSKNETLVVTTKQ